MAGRYYKVGVVGMINSWQIVNTAFTAAHDQSLLRLAEFLEGRNGMLYVVPLLPVAVETAITRSNLSAFDVGA